jgi:hypothetical protein
VIRPELEEKLPRMDIAIFVGFATKGALHIPTLVEDANAFTEKFGDDLKLAWDTERGDYVYAYLAPTVRAFFRNGGQRCWVVRVPTPEPNQFNADSFLDPRLKSVIGEHLLAEAEFIRSLQQDGQLQQLTGIYAALEREAEEATIIAVPDAVHRGWREAPPESIPPPVPSLPPQRPAWWHFLDCDPPPKIEQVSNPQWGQFLDCALRVIEPPPFLTVDLKAEAATAFTLLWPSSPPQVNVVYVLQEALLADFSDAVVVYSGSATSYDVYGRAPGYYYYRVRAEMEGDVSDWSNGAVVSVPRGPRLEYKSASEYQPDTLLAVHRALLRMNAARGDLFAVLSLPEHYREDEAITYARRLQQTPDQEPPTEAVPALGYGEQRALSYGALYHPWLIGREETRPVSLTQAPPCGAASGVLAARAVQRGAWVAPANEPLHGVVALAPPLLRQRWQHLQDARINIVRQEARGFLVLDADTLDDDIDLGLINIRRLMSLLRRLVLQLGVTYVFEPHDAAFRRTVKRGFEARLEEMFSRGAFAGATPATSYRVVVDDTVNPPTSVEQGRFIVELRVAPSAPLQFLTIRLVQRGERGVLVEGR